MEDMNVKASEIEELELITEVEETSDSSNAGSLIAGIVGGFIAYAIIGGAKKLRVIAEKKWAARKQAEIAANSVEDESIDEAQADSDEDDSEE